MNTQLKNTSKLLSFLLRHQPEAIGLTLDSQGWANIDELIACAVAHKKTISREAIVQAVAQNDKQRFTLSRDGEFIRANQGHSIKVDLQLLPVTPPDILYHGTASRFMPSIETQGILPSGRHHVHLSADRHTAFEVGKRHGQVVILTVFAGQMSEAGIEFFQSENGVWLTSRVAPEYYSVVKTET